MAREIESPQLQIGQTPIAEIKFDLKSRDDIPKILRGLQYIYVTATIREPIFKLLEEKILSDVLLEKMNKKTTRVQNGLLDIEILERKYPNWKKEYIAFCGEDKADEVIENTEPKQSIKVSILEV